MEGCENTLFNYAGPEDVTKQRSCIVSELVVACVASVIGEREGERGRREKMRGIGERGEGEGEVPSPLSPIPLIFSRLPRSPSPSPSPITPATQAKLVEGNGYKNRQTSEGRPIVSLLMLKVTSRDQEPVQCMAPGVEDFMLGDDFDAMMAVLGRV